MSEPLVQIAGLDLYYQSRHEKHHALKSVSIEVREGETIGLVGESGSGKSTLAHAIIDLLPPQAQIQDGQLQAFDKNLREDREIGQTLRGREIAMIFQDPMTSLTPHMNILEQMIEPMILVQKMSSNEARAKAQELLTQVEIPNPELVLQKFPHELSGGMSQRVMIAIALSANPKLLIADEPTTALDVTTQATILEVIQKLQREKNMALIFVSHDLGVIHQICDRIYVMNKGQVVESGSSQAILSHPKDPYTQSLIASIPRLSGPKLDMIPCLGSDFEMPPQLNLSQEVVLEVKDLEVAYETKSLFSSQRFVAVENSSFDLKQGEVLGIVGESGSGKSTTAKAISGLIPYTQGEVLYKAQKLQGFHSDIQMVFQDPASSLNPRMSIGRNIAEGIIHKQNLTPSDLEKKCIQLLDHVDLPHDYLHRYPHEISGGQKQRIGIARSLASSPKLLICDEPVSALDVSIQAQVLNLLKKLQRELQLSMLFITHDISVVRFIADRLLVMRSGKIVETGKVDELLENPKELYTQKLLSSVPKMDF